MFQKKQAETWNGRLQIKKQLCMDTKYWFNIIGLQKNNINLATESIIDSNIVTISWLKIWKILSARAESFIYLSSLSL
jgi:hypothetical protein